MSDFRARIIAQLDTSEIPSQINRISRDNTVYLNNVRLNTTNLYDQIQSELNRHRFTINVGNVGIANTDAQMRNAGNAAGRQYGQAIVNQINRIRRHIDTGGIETDIARVTARFDKLGSIDDSRLRGVSQSLERLRDLQRQLNTDADDDTLLRVYGDYDIVLRQVRNTLTTISEQTKNFITAEDVHALDQKMSLWLNKNPRAIDDYGASIEGLRRRLHNLDITSSDAQRQLDGIEQELKDIDNQARLAGKTGTTFGHQLTNAFKSIWKYVGVSTIIGGIVDALRRMYDNVYDVNTAMTELKKVTDETDRAYDKFLDNAGEKAKKIGTTISEYVNSTADFARLGYDMADADYLAEVANIYAVVGDDISGIDEATQSIISTMTAFKVETEDAMLIVDKFNKVSNNFAISSGGIGDALQRSASSLAAAGNSLDQSIALITAANTVVQDADAVGTAYKTLSMRIRGAKTELEAAGLDIEGMADSTAKLRSEILALSGVDIMLDEDTFKSTYDILDELSQKWGELNDITQASITELIAGKRQGQIMSSLMANFDIARKVLSTSEGAEGSAYAEHEKWLESLEAKVKQFQAAFQDLSMTILNDEGLGRLIDLGTGLIEVLDNIIEGFGLQFSFSFKTGSELEP